MANEKISHSRYRKYGEVQPCWKVGVFKIRLPFVHYAWSVPEMLQALFMCATCLGAIPVLTEVLGVEYGVALSMVIINGFFYNTIHRQNSTIKEFKTLLIFGIAELLC